jgi:hypothetical protein
MVGASDPAWLCAPPLLLPLLLPPLLWLLLLRCPDRDAEDFLDWTFSSVSDPGAACASSSAALAMARSLVLGAFPKEVMAKGVL